jgi:hypothetical protein
MGSKNELKERQLNQYGMTKELVPSTSLLKNSNIIAIYFEF